MLHRCEPAFEQSNVSLKERDGARLHSSNSNERQIQRRAYPTPHSCSSALTLLPFLCILKLYSLAWFASGQFNRTLRAKCH